MLVRTLFPRTLLVFLSGISVHGCDVHLDVMRLGCKSKRQTCLLLPPKAPFKLRAGVAGEKYDDPEIDLNCGELLSCFEEIHPRLEIDNEKSAGAVKTLLSMGATRDQIIRMFKGNPNMFLLPQEENSLLSLQSCFEEFGVQTPFVLKSFALFPYLASKNPTEVHKVLSFLKNDLGVQNLSQIVAGCPSVFGYRVERLQSKVKFYSDLGLDARKLLEKSPSILNYKEEEMTIKYEFFQILFGEEAPKVVEKVPALLTMKIETVQETLDNLFALFGEEPALSMILRYPGVIQKSWSSTQEKLDFITRVMGRNLEEVFLNPVVLSYSVQKRMKPRFEALQRAGLDTEEKRFGLSTIFCPSDAKFESRFQVQLPT